MSLSARDFPAYFEAVHGHAPFAWQCRLLDHVLDQGWQGVLDLPTASGKTAVLDIAVMALAIEATTQRRRTPRRIGLVVDRRIVVDDASRRAAKIAAALNTQTVPSVLARMQAALLSLGGERALDHATLRGGIYREDRWARTPLQPVLLCSTVDQIGSRLLHRGYGLSNHAWPIHAGLLGHDTLLVLDEAHCSLPFLQTLRAIGRWRLRAQEPLTGPWAAVAMTATPPAGEPAPFRLTLAERREPLLARRLQATKRARLEVVEAKGTKSDEALAKHVVDRLTQPATDEASLAGPGCTTLVVVNRVRAARQIFDRLRNLTGVAAANFPCTPLLLTGRSRSIERDSLLEEHRSRLLAGRDRAAARDLPALVVVATQCIEVGADIDADALITEACPLDSLRQRFGRLDRLGERHAAGRGNSALILARSEHVGSAATDDPVYADRLAATWRWLQDHASDNTIDCGIEALDALGPPLAELAAPHADAPLMFPAYCDLWVQTGPAPAVSPDPAIFLHGPRSGPADVQVVWRADLDPEHPDTWVATIAACPPTSGEALPLPLHLVRAFLGTGEDLARIDQGGDVEGARAPEDDDAQQAARFRPALRWAGPENSALVEVAEAVYPGATLVMPCAAGGADDFGWTGVPGDVPRDLADAGWRAARRPAILRIHPLLASAYWGDDSPEGWTALASLRGDRDEGLPTEAVLRQQILVALPAWIEVARESSLRHALAALQQEGEGIRVTPHPSGVGLLASGRRRLAAEARDFTDEDDASSLSPRGVVTLEGHLRDVRDWAVRIAEQAGLPGRLVDALARAGHLHDLGKADPRFQAWLRGGNRLRVDRRRPLAKSDRIRFGAAARQARQLSGYPEGARHELLSVRLAESAPSLLPDEPILRDLVLHLVASHHGRCRPWAPLVGDERAIDVCYRHEGHDLSASSATGLEHLGSGMADRFWRLIRHFGWWGLSYLEACLRLADHRASESPAIEEDA
jgi:CRISPR-associated endonuclease/helicase Cas3